MTTKILSVFGTRPEASKMSSVVHELTEYPDHFESRVCVAAQVTDELAERGHSPEIVTKLGIAGPASMERYSLACVGDRWETLNKSVAEAKGQ